MGSVFTSRRLCAETNRDKNLDFMKPRTGQCPVQRHSIPYYLKFPGEKFAQQRRPKKTRFSPGPVFCFIDFLILILYRISIDYTGDKHG